MGSALARGSLKSHFLKENEIVAYDSEKEKLESFCKELNVVSAASNSEAVLGSDYIFLCVKPQQMKELLSEIGPKLQAKQCLVSIAAGVRINTIEKALSGNIPLVRVMPNTPAMVEMGMTAVTKGKNATEDHLKFVVNFFSSVGKVVVLEEELFDTVTAVSGSGPAYFFHLTEALEEAGKKLGLKPELAKLFSRQTCLGAAQMLMGSEDPKVLREKVTSPGGTTEAALKYLQEKDWSNVFIEAVHCAQERSKVLSSLV